MKRNKKKVNYTRGESNPGLSRDSPHATRLRHVDTFMVGYPVESVADLHFKCYGHLQRSIMATPSLKGRAVATKIKRYCLCHQCLRVNTAGDLSLRLIVRSTRRD